jgi:ribosome biogenesis protein NSA1
MHSPLFYRRIYSCTSAGAFRLTTLDTSTPTISITSTTELTLPSPLQDCTFLYPPPSSSSSSSSESQDPTHFAYGGEEIPLSLWHVDSAFQSSSSNQTQPRASTEKKPPPPSPSSQQQDGEETLNSKQRKRKRQAEARAAAKELLDGEVFRAKNLANDGLGLPQRAQITSIAFVHSHQKGSEVEGEQEKEEETSALIPKDLWILTGTREGLIRLFHPSSGVRKRISEFRVTPAEQEGNAIKALANAGESSGVVYASDASQKVFAVDWRKGKVLGQLKEINGSVTAMQALPPPLSLSKLGRSPSSSAPFQRLITSSQDRLLRLHHTPTYASKLDSSAPSSSGSASVRDARLYAHAFAAQAPVTAIAWLGNVPACTVEKAEGKPEELDHSGVSVGEEEDEDFEGMEMVGAGVESSDEEEDEENEDVQEEEVSTTAKKGNGKPAKRVRLAA